MGSSSVDCKCVLYHVEKGSVLRPVRDDKLRKWRSHTGLGHHVYVVFTAPINKNRFFFKISIQI